MKTARFLGKLPVLSLVTALLAFVANPVLAQVRPPPPPPTNGLPSVNIITPIDGQVFPAPGDVHITANINTGSNFVRFVGLFANRTQIAFFLVDPGPTNYNLLYDWSSVPPGTYSLTAAVTNTVGQYATSPAVTISVVSNSPIPIVSIVATDPIASVTGDTGVFTVYRQGGNISNSLTVLYAISGTASNGVDYATIPNTVTIPAGTNSAQIVINPVVDATPDPTESVILTLIQPPTGAPTTYIIGRPSTAEVDIIGNINLPPVVSILVPSNGASFYDGADIRILAVAQDPDGFVRSVEFFNGTNSLGVVSNSIIVVDPPFNPGGPHVTPFPAFSLVWSNVPPGAYTLTAVATDNGGATGTSGLVNITVTTNVPPPPTNIPPFVHIETPTNGSLFYSNQNVQICAAAFDVDGFVTTVQFFNGSNSIGTVSNVSIVFSNTVNRGIPPVNLLCLTWSNVPPGNYTLTAVATDNGGATGTSDAVSITVSTNPPPPPTNIPPIVAIVTPPDGSVFTAPACIFLEAFARDPDGFVTSVEFFNGTNSLGIASNCPTTVGSWGTISTRPIIYPTDPFFLIWSNVPVGNYKLTAVATDNGGATGVSQPVNIAVVSPPPITNPPVVTIFATDPIAVEGTNFPYRPPPTVVSNFCSGTNTATFLVRREGDISYDLTIPYAVSGTAIPGVDYIALPGFVTIPAGRKFALITVVPLDDIDPTTRRFDTVIVTLTPPPPFANPLPPPYIVGRPGSAEAIILEDYDLPGPRTGMMTDHSFHLSWPGTNGSFYSVEVSSDLQTWTPIGTNVVLKGSIHFADPEAIGLSGRYYRVVTAGPPSY